MYNDNKIYGIPEGVSYGQNERVDELNRRISSRHFPDIPLQPNYNPRPVPTKYSIFPIIDRVKPVKELELKYVDYYPEVFFNPGSAKAPVNGFINNVDIETNLRNQTMALQHGAEQNVYVPSSNSDLYNVTVISKPSEQPYPLLFSQPYLNQSIHPNIESSKIGREMFFNHTRTQMRNGL